ncbi:DnaT-like ssDNA-binding domain-containing protein [Pseudomonas sp. R32]|uniref:DnaT-like ssDNA-binding domain-containing protein n=1 Tax=Pseudomonas sp. R32 TaxID=1573704 RepID=UPI00132F148C|nr:DnaT-like ssDNA-binding domain-containing protein [Pseudomonas sp. R32]QHF28556.1 hypothetical protein PspR32_12375 [Pseudomonas sp. R32]
MARARNIKPGLFSNELLAELPAFDRLLFIGMWCLADREGRLEDRPKRIKMELFPCDDYDVDAGLSRLAVAGFVSRYQVESFSVIEIDNFQKHQNPHGSEKDSVLPDKDGYLTVNERKKNVVLPGKQRKVHVKEQVFNVNPPLEPVNPTANNALIPDSPNPDSLIPEEDQHNTQRAEQENSADPKAPCEMTLEWVPDQKLLKAYAARMGIPVDRFTAEATAAFVCHYSASCRVETQASWVSLLVKWVKRDSVSASNIRQFPLRRQVNGPDFDGRDWAENMDGVL